MTQKLFNYENLYKLITKEDSFFIHKILGGIVLLNYGYRYIYYSNNGDMNIKTNVDMYLILLHGVLSVSSLNFHISNVRNPQQPMIYPEYRMHSIIFVCRSIICCFIHYCEYSYKYIMAVCALTFIAADLITLYYNRDGKNGKTMRNMPFDNSVSIKDQTSVRQMHSYHQIGATIYMFGNIDTAFSPMFAIQIAAFLMTMVRKGIINTMMWHYLYSVSLWINYLLFTSVTPSFFILLNAIVLTHCNVVFYYKINKYIGWTAHFLCIYFYKELRYDEYINEIVLFNYHREWFYFTRIVVLLAYIFMVYKYKILFMQFL